MLFYKIGQQEFIKVCSKCNKKWSIIPYKCEQVNAVFVCDTCNSNDKDDTDINKNKKDEKRKTTLKLATFGPKAAELNRKKNPVDDDDSLIFTIKEKDIADVMDTIKKT